MWSEWLVVCDCGFSLSALWCPLSVPTILLGFLLPWAWGVSSWLLQQSAAAAPYLGQGVSPHRFPSWPWMRSRSSRPSCSHSSLEVGLLLPAAALDLGPGVAPLRRVMCTSCSHTKSFELETDSASQQCHTDVVLETNSFSFLQIKENFCSVVTFFVPWKFFFFLNQSESVH